MPICFHCGQEVAETTHCNECGQDYCMYHQDPLNHDCNIVKESLHPQQFQYSQPASTYVAVPRSPTLQERVNQQQKAEEDNGTASTQRGSTDYAIRGTTDGSFTWHHEEKFIPENAFDPDSGIHFKGILLPHKSEFFHLLIGASLIFIIGLMGFWNPMLIDIGLTWAIFMLAGFYTTAFLFHEFGHRQVAKHFNLQTKFRLLTFGMVLTFVSLMLSASSLIMGQGAFPSLALPGAVVVLGLEKADRKTGLCKAAGPIVNLVYGTVLLVISFLIDRNLYPLNLFIAVAASLNFSLGLFNMIPIGILDGQNIFKWNKQLYILLVAVLILLLIITYANMYAPIETSLYVPEQYQQAAQGA